jgi:transcriptional regulator with XRE-family HTH domain
MTEEGQEILIVFGANLKKLRLAKGLTILDLEVRSGINNGDISKIENGKRNLSFTTLAKLAEGLGVTIKELVDF